jgi:RNA polymerase sigma factor (sigma-70 family)
MMTQQTLDNCIEGCRRGDRKSQELVYNNFSRAMFAVCMQYANSRMEAEDILQESFVKVFSRIDTYTGEGPFGGWIRRIIVNTALSAYRKNKLKLTALGVVRDEEEPYTTPVYHEESAIMATLSTLPENQRVPFSMHVIDGYSHKEIAEITGMSVVQSRVQVCRAKTRLRDTIMRIEQSFNQKIYSDSLCF